MNLASHYYSKHLIDKTIDDMDNDIPDLHIVINRRNKKINFVNISTIITLILGILFILSFVSVNAVNMSKQNNNKASSVKRDKQQNGRSIPKIAPKINEDKKPNSLNK